MWQIDQRCLATNGSTHISAKHVVFYAHVLIKPFPHISFHRYIQACLCQIRFKMSPFLCKCAAYIFAEPCPRLSCFLVSRTILYFIAFVEYSREHTKHDKKGAFEVCPKTSVTVANLFCKYTENPLFSAQTTINESVFGVYNMEHHIECFWKSWPLSLKIYDDENDKGDGWQSNTQKV